METWYDLENEIRDHEGDRDATIKNTEAQETGRYNEWDFSPTFIFSRRKRGS